MKIFTSDFQVNEIGAFQPLHFMVQTLQHSNPNSCAGPAGISRRYCKWCSKELCTLEGATVHGVEELDQARQSSKSCKKICLLSSQIIFSLEQSISFVQAMQTSEMVLTSGDAGDS